MHKLSQCIAIRLVSNMIPVFMMVLGELGIKTRSVTFLLICCPVGYLLFYLQKLALLIEPISVLLFNWDSADHYTNIASNKDRS